MSFESLAISAGVAGSVLWMGATSVLGVAELGETASGYEKLGALAILAFAVVYMLTKYLPSLHKQHAEAIKDMQNTHASSIDTLVKAFREEQTAQREHDQTAREQILKEIRDL